MTKKQHHLSTKFMDPKQNEDWVILWRKNGTLLRHCTRSRQSDTCAVCCQASSSSAANQVSQDVRYFYKITQPKQKHIRSRQKNNVFEKQKTLTFCPTNLNLHFKQRKDLAERNETKSLKLTWGSLCDRVKSTALKSNMLRVFSKAIATCS